MKELDVLLERFVHEHYGGAAPEQQAAFRRLLELNPLTHLMSASQAVLFFDAPFNASPQLLGLAAISLLVFLVGYFVFDRLRDTLAEEV